MATSAIPMCPRSPRCRRSCREFRSPRGWPAWRCCSPRRSAFRSASSARSSRAPGSITRLRVVSLSGLSLPSFWLGLLILMASVAMFGTMPIFNPNPKTWTEAIAIYCRSGDGGRLSQRRADHAHHPLLDARNPAAGLHPHRPRQGRVRTLRQLSPRAEERRAARHHRDRHRGGVPDRRTDRHRDRFQYSRRRPLPGRGDPLARLSDRAEPGDADRRWSSWSRTSPSTCSTPRSIHASGIRIRRSAVGRHQLR